MAGADRMERWRDKWQANEIRFHLSVVNPNLERWYHRLASDDTPVSVLVPLCGKTLDMMWWVALRCVVPPGVLVVRSGLRSRVL